jgi:hypothetical protein
MSIAGEVRSYHRHANGVPAVRLTAFAQQPGKSSSLIAGPGELECAHTEVRYDSEA